MPEISALPPAGVLDGSELVPAVADGVTSQTTTADIAALAGGGGSRTLIEEFALVANHASPITFSTIRHRRPRPTRDAPVPRHLQRDRLVPQPRRDGSIAPAGNQATGARRGLG